MSARILIVEDEPAISRAVAYALVQEGFEVDCVADGESALDAGPTADVVVLDLMLPGLPGTDVLRRLRASSAVPIIVLSARATEVDRVLGLELGADDYVTKPFSIAELVSRVRAVVRRRELDLHGLGDVRHVGDMRIDVGRHEVTIDDRLVYLTPSQFKLLSLLAQTPGRVVSRREIMEELWASTHVGDEHACDVHISNLRHKIERDPTHPARICTVRGTGYRLASG